MAGRGKLLQLAPWARLNALYVFLQTHLVWTSLPTSRETQNQSELTAAITVTVVSSASSRAGRWGERRPCSMRPLATSRAYC